MVPEVGVEPTCPRGAGDFESPASTSFTTPAQKGKYPQGAVLSSKNVIDNKSGHVLNAHLHYINGAVAQLGERLNGIQEVTSSILVSSTRNSKGLTESVKPFLLENGIYVFNLSVFNKIQ